MKSAAAESSQNMTRSAPVTAFSLNAGACCATPMLPSQLHTSPVTHAPGSTTACGPSLQSNRPPPPSPLSSLPLPCPSSSLDAAPGGVRWYPVKGAASSTDTVFGESFSMEEADALLLLPLLLSAPSTHPCTTAAAGATRAPRSTTAAAAAAAAVATADVANALPVAVAATATADTASGATACTSRGLWVAAAAAAAAAAAVPAAPSPISRSMLGSSSRTIAASTAACRGNARTRWSGVTLPHRSTWPSSC
jgi:hypothetical protein